MEPTLIARSAKRDRWDVDHGQIWSEYRLRPAGFTGSGYVLEMRYIRTEGDQINEQPWIMWQVGTTATEAIEEGMGDTAYEGAESIHPYHAAAVKRSRAIRQANHDAYIAEKAAAAAVEEVKRYRFECNWEFDKKTRDMAPDKAEACKQRMLKTRGPHMDALKAQAEATAERARETRKIAEALSKEKR